MAEGIVYLDVDDEITSAASRIRSAPGTKVALVVPNGSRIATSRINFRLLSREALVSNRRLSVIAGDAASRALAASAGLPVFATIAEYEAALAGPKPADDAEFQPRHGAAAQVDTGPLEPAAAPTPSSRPRRSRTTGASAAPAGGSIVAASNGGAGSGVDDTRRFEIPLPAPVRVGDRELRGPQWDPPPVASPRRIGLRTPVIVTIAAVGLAAVLIGVAGYLLLPSATIALTPRQEPISLPLTIAADPTATAVDAANGIVPAVRLDVPVEVGQTFTTAGKHVEQSPASGSVTFTSYNTGSSNTIAAGSVISTEGGIRFKTLATITLPAAQVIPPSTIVPTRRSVAVQAAQSGPAGNVPSNSIRIVPQGENPDLLRVNNPDPTSGGVRTETPEVSKADVDKAVAALQTALQASFIQAIDGGAGAPAGTQVFRETAALGATTPSVDPTTLIGKPVPTFDLGMSAAGTVIAVDSSPIRAIAEGRLRDRIGADHRLVDGSLKVEVGPGTVGSDGQVTFEATAQASRVAVIDADKLRTLVKGRTASEVAAALAPFGEAKVDLWPAWVSTVTGIDARLSLSVTGQGASTGAGSQASPAPVASGASGTGPLPSTASGGP